LWKFNENLGWESPWGRGFPGWHIECSAMSAALLGQPFDIHTGGIDHIPVHHNNEIAQSEAAYGKPLANYWMHNEFITVRDAKMAKSAGDFITLETLEKESITPLAYRYWLLTAHYRSQVNFSFEAVRAAQNAFERLKSFVSGCPDNGAINTIYQQKFLSFVNDDLDVPQALALTWDLVKDQKVSDADKRATILDFDRVLGLGLAETFHAETSEKIPQEITALAEARKSARQQKDWKKADELRQEIEKQGYIVSDTDKEYKLIKK